MNLDKTNKYGKLVIGLVVDALGMASFAIPGVGEFSDVIWAPASAFIMTKLYKGKAGKVGAVISFLEEAMPGLDFVPTFTLMWLYTYVLKSEKGKSEVIDVN